MDAMIGYCGYNCAGCGARSDDPAVRAKLVEAWRRYLGHEAYTVENVHCNGCKGGGLLADRSCQARPCAVARGVEICAECPDFPCPKVGGLLCSREQLLLLCAGRGGGITEEEYDLALRQFDSLGNVIEGLVRAGRLPAWCGRRGTRPEGEGGA